MIEYKLISYVLLLVVVEVVECLHHRHLMFPIDPRLNLLKFYDLMESMMAEGVKVEEVGLGALNDHHPNHGGVSTEKGNHFFLRFVSEILYEFCDRIIMGHLN